MNQIDRNLERRRRLSVGIAAAATVLAPLTVLATGAATTATAAPSSLASAAVAGEITHTVIRDGKTYTLRLAPFTLRSPKFEVLVQQADGSMVKQDIGAERSFLGSVDGDSAATVSAIRRSDGVLIGSIVFDRGTQWRFEGGTVSEVRGSTQPSSYGWPSASNTSYNRSTAPGQAGTTTYRWDVGYDLASDWFTDPGTINGSVATALDTVERTVAEMASLYETNALLRPALGRVIVRADRAADPYASGMGLGQLANVWADTQQDADVDVVVGNNSPSGSGGVAYMGTAATGWTSAKANGPWGKPNTVRHEVGHNWGVDDYHTNNPEGSTVNSGNSYARFDGTEVSAILRHRDSVKNRLTPVSTATTALPPYAALDMVDNATSGVVRRINPVANDHDANGDALTLASVQPTSSLGGTVTMGPGNTVNYTPPTVSTADTLDSVTYVVRDASGKTATGAVVFKVDPFVDPGPATTWPTTSSIGSGNQYGFVNKQSGLAASARSENLTSPDLVQRADSSVDASRFTLIGVGGTSAAPWYRVKNAATGKCADVGASVQAGSVVTQSTCTDYKSMKWRVVNHPQGGQALLSVKSGLCLAPQEGSLLVDAPLTQVACGLDLATAWTLEVGPVSKWKPAAAPDPAKSYVMQVRDTSVEAMVDADEWIQLAAAGAGTPLSFVQNTDGTWTIKNAAKPWRCEVNWTNSDFAQATCGTEASKSWRLLQHPLGGVALQSVSTGKCVQPKDGATSTGTWVGFGTCSAEATQRWNLAAAPAA